LGEKEEVKQRPITSHTDSEGTFVRVPLGPEATYFAEIALVDWERLLKDGFTGNLNYVDGNNGKLYPTIGVGHRLIGRLICNAGPRERVVYLDGNPLNLRRSNLSIKKTSRPGNYRGAA